jgi:hypothetical protein
MKNTDWSKEPEAWMWGALIAVAIWASLIFSALLVLKVIDWVLR